MLRIVFSKSILMLSLLIGLPSSSFSQILDDSTILVYGPSTLNVILEENLKSNDKRLVFIDTLVGKLDQFTAYDRSDYKLQNLGNIGTALFPVFYDLPNAIGAHAGYHAFDPLTTQPTDIQYYDTKSPFMKLNVVFGGKNRSLANFSFTQNIQPDWNFGFEYFRSTADKQIGTETINDRNVINTVLNVHSSYRHPNKPYQVLFNLISFNNDVDETGGLYFDDVDSLIDKEDKFQYENNSIFLENAKVKDSRITFHLYQQYDLFKNFQLYHQFDQGKQVNLFSDFNENNGGGGDYKDYYDQFLIDPDSTYHKSTFRTLSNEVGLIGKLSSIFYRFYIKNRVVKHEALYFNPMSRKVENYLGGRVDFRWKEIFEIQGSAELMQTGEYNFKGSLKSELINLEYKSMLYQPSSLKQRFFGNHYDWDHDFDNVFSNQINGFLSFNWWQFQFIPKISLTSYSNYVYFAQDKMPNVAADANLISQLGGEINLFLPTNKTLSYGFRFKNEVIFTKVSGGQSDAFRIPTTFLNMKAYWEGSWFNHTIPVQIGIDVHHKSAYYANAYDPVTQQFYLQNDEKIFEGYSYPTNLFWNMRIEKVFLFIKSTHISQPNDGGYFVTPKYPGQQRVLDFGFKWLFFD